MQNVLDSMRYDNLRNTSSLNIPDCNKNGRYPCSDSVRHLRSNASPGPSHPRGNNGMGDDPSEPSGDSSSTDSTYRCRQEESEDMDTTTHDMDEDNPSSNKDNQ